MSDKTNDSEVRKGLHVLEEFLFHEIGKKTTSDGKKKKSPKQMDEIKDRVLLRIERAEIMSAMLSMRGEHGREMPKH